MMPYFYTQLWPDPCRNLASMDSDLMPIRSMDSDLMPIRDSQIDKDKLPKSFIFIQAEVLPHFRTLITYPLISDADISADNLGLAKNTSV